MIFVSDMLFQSFLHAIYKNTSAFIGIKSAILDFRLPVASTNSNSSIFVPLDTETWGIDVEIIL